MRGEKIMIETVSISDASQETGLSQKQLRDYEAKGYINPSIKVRSGSISYRRYTPEHIEEIKIFRKYLGQGFRLPVASQKAFEDLGEGEEKNE
jgi:DNA-binding transcriptional MerR regulator